MQITDQMKAELINAGWIPPDTVREKTLKWFITSADEPPRESWRPVGLSQATTMET